MNQSIISKIKSSPSLPGVYIFTNNKEVVYVGKASSLKERLKSYLDLSNQKNQTIGKYATNLKWIITENDVEALIVESNLIKKHLPRVNVVLKDNKNYFFVNISKDTFPKLSLTHRKDESSYQVGPFTSGTHLKHLLSLLRPIFPYCNCKTKHQKPCLSSQLNLCLGFCCLKDAKYSKEQKNQYLQNIKNIIKILNGDNKKLIKDLKLQLQKEVVKQNFEKALVIKNQILALENIFKHRQFLNKTESSNYSDINQELKDLFQTKTKITNIEMYDVSNISGKFAVASLAMFSNGIPSKNNYKKFKIKYTKLEPNDILMLKEVFQRRVLNTQWLQPDLILIDGGITQLKTAINIFANNKDFKNVLLGSLAKGKKQLLVFNKEIKYFDLSKLSKELANMLKAIQDESHRFAISYHHKLYIQNLKNDQ